MTVCLAVDTVTSSGSVALQVDYEIVADKTFFDRQHAAQLLPSIMMCLQEVGLKPEDIDEVLVADGPGSFTGMRIGFATVAGLIAPLSPRIFVAPSMLATAVSLAVDGYGAVVAMYDALRGEVYAGCYKVMERVVETVYSPHVTTVPALVDLGHEKPIAAVGSGSLAYASQIESWIGAAPLADPAHAKNLIGLRALSGGLEEIVDLSSFELNYGRKAEAQVRWERQHGRRLSDSIGST